MEEQMSLFDMGGLADDGAMRDPVSGNEVPPGSMASEVRDDVPAMLSEGEYIVPADVVRYYGVKFFEDLRSQAKSGLMDMEQNGRIGGEPVPGPGPGMEEELSPEEMAMLAELTGMYGGGMVRKGYTNGGLEDGQPGVAQMTQQDFMNQAQQAAGFQLPRSIFTPPTPTTTTTAPSATPATLYGPTGDVIVLMLPTDQARYNELLSQGYTTEPQEAAATMQESGGDDSGVDVGGAEVTTGGGFSLSDENREALNNDPLSFGMEALEAGMPLGATTRQIGQVGGFLGGVPGIAIGGLAGAAMELDNVAKARAGLEVARARGLTDTPEFTALETSLENAIANLSGPARFLERLGLGSGTNYAEQIEGLTITPTIPARTGGGGGVSSPGMTARPDTDPFEGLSGADLLPPPREESSADRARRGSEEVISRARENLATEQEIADMQAEATKAETQLADLESRASGGRNTTGRVGFEKGGLVSKPTRKKPVAKKK